MYLDNIRAFDDLTLAELEAVLDEHTRKPVPTNEYTAFSWSVSRHNLFARCKRQYYLNYYGPRRVRDRGNHPVVGALWWLKQARTLRMWLGSVVHEVAREAVLAHWDGMPMDVEEGVERALATFNGGVRASSRGTRFEGEWVVLQEHVYPDDYEQADWDGAEKMLAEMIETLFASDAYEAIVSSPPEAVLEVDEPFQSMTFDGTRVFAVPDVMMLEGDVHHIIDWKTGDAGREEIRAQAGVYALYANQKYGVPEQQIRVTISDLGGGGRNVSPPGGVPSLEEAAAFVRGSMASMRNMLDSEKYNTVAIIDYPMTDDLSLCRGCNFKRACWRHEMAWEE